MGKDSGIQWTHHTYNAWWGCQRVSEGCRNCYAETFAKRVGQKVWGGADSPRRFFGDAHWAEPLKWDKAAAKAGERHRVFCSSMADVFEDRADLVEPRRRLLDLIVQTPNLDWLLLTKRPENMRRLMADAGMGGEWNWNIWAGTTAENQAMADERIPHLLRVPARVRFLSCEPLLEALDLTNRGNRWSVPTARDRDGRGIEWTDPPTNYIPVDWVIIGGESGPKARPFDLAWARSLVKQCRDAGVAPFVKQLGAHVRWDGFAGLGRSGWPAGTVKTDDDHVLDGRGWRVRLRDSAGGDPAEWPEDLRVREMPAGAAPVSAVQVQRSLPVVQGGAE